jgi:hypothetical protein
LQFLPRIAEDALFLLPHKAAPGRRRVTTRIQCSPYTEFGLRGHRSSTQGGPWRRNRRARPRAGQDLRPVEFDEVARRGVYGAAGTDERGHDQARISGQ